MHVATCICEGYAHKLSRCHSHTPQYAARREESRSTGCSILGTAAHSYELLHQGIDLVDLVADALRLLLLLLQLALDEPHYLGDVGIDPRAELGTVRRVKGVDREKQLKILKHRRAEVPKLPTPLLLAPDPQE